MDRIRETEGVRPALLAAFFMCAGLIGCAAPQEGSDANITRTVGAATYGLQGYLQAGSSNSRLIALQGAALAGQPIDQSLLDGSFSAPSIRARVAVLVLINAYVTKLAALTDNDTQLEELETAKTLEPQIAELPRSLATLRDPTAARYSAPVAAVLGWVGQSYVDTQRGRATSEALQTAAPAANQLLDLLDADLKTVQGQRLGGSADLLEQERAYYNANLRRLSLSDRESLVGAMAASAAAHQRAETPAPAALVQALRTMHAALVTYVSSGRTKADEQTVSQAMEDFAATVEPIAPSLR